MLLNNSVKKTRIWVYEYDCNNMVVLTDSISDTVVVDCRLDKIDSGLDCKADKIDTVN